MDLTGPIIVPPYYQISFKSLKLFKDCPRKFYYNIILGIGPEDIGDSVVLEEDDSSGVEWIKEDDEMGLSQDALLLGLIVHGYLERHHF